ncbi:hypothetical protein R3P38DRAFT_2524700, partial [Favolaschia claudopus]
CPGVVVNWNVPTGPMGWTLPWHRVMQSGANQNQTEFFRVEVDSSEVTRAFSKRCTGSTADEVCAECKIILRRIGELAAIATEPKPHTNYRFLNYAQVTDVAVSKESELRKLRLKYSRFGKRIRVPSFLPS